MGHRKIDISRIQNDRHRQVTFAKRKLGVMKKATELSILCNANVAIIVFSANNKMSVYSSCPINTLVQRYLETRESAEVRPPRLARRGRLRRRACRPSRSAHATCVGTQVVTTEDYFREKAREALAAVDSDDGAPNRHVLSSTGSWPITATNADGSFSFSPRPYAHHMSQGFSSQPNQGIPLLQVSPTEQTQQAIQRQMLQLQQQQQQVQQQQMQLMQQQIQHHQQEMQQFQMQQQQAPQALAQQSQQITQPPVQPQLQQVAPQQPYQGFPRGQQAMIQAQGSQNQAPAAAPPPMLMQQPAPFQSFALYPEKKLQINADPGQTPQQLQLQLQQLQQQQSFVQQQLESVQRQLLPSPAAAAPPVASEMPRHLALSALQ